MSGKEPSFSIGNLTQGFEAWKAEVYEELGSDPPPWAIELEANVFDAATTMRKRADECMNALEAIRIRVVGIEKLLAASPVMLDFSLVKEEHERGVGASEELTTAEAVSTQPREPQGSKPIRVKVPEPKVYDGVRDAKTWSEFKAELRKRFYPANAEHEVRKKLRSVRHGGKNHEYISQFTSLMLCVSDMSDADRLFSFLDGLKRRDVKTHAEALPVAKRLTEFEKSSDG
ncbi:hypothetical protein H6P81_006657 [Aristolochia fimbriata]|uniref:Retrotransposon gag domain-containing protein n=1 Tax=Aristolochia fimbriata TaxID=158543 RepID=A0AAV7F2G8_ARIFI|nr:hypothetical protein H6P81_006657 [Aristolochia fimbriata]